MSTVLTADAEHLVIGFIHDMSNSCKDMLVPNEIIKLCVLFYYSNTPKRLLISSYFNDSKFVHIFDPFLRKSVHLSLPRSVLWDDEEVIIPLTEPLCYIDNISSMMDIEKLKSKTYDGLVCIQREELFYPSDSITWRPQLIILDRSEIKQGEYKNFKSISGAYLSGVHYNKNYKNLIPFDKFLNCGSKYGIIYFGTHYGPRLYQLKLQTVNINGQSTLKFNAMDIKFLNKLQAMNQGLTMDYLDCTEKIFALQYGGRYTIKSATSLQRLCGLIDLQKNQLTNSWKYDTFDTEFALTGKFKPALCHDSAENEIYCVSNKSVITKFNLKKEQWILIKNSNEEIADKINTFLTPTIWMKNDTILCMSSGSFFAEYDMRSNDKKWIEMREMRGRINAAISNAESSRVYIHL